MSRRPCLLPAFAQESGACVHRRGSACPSFSIAGYMAAWTASIASATAVVEDGPRRPGRVGTRCRRCLIRPMWIVSSPGPKSVGAGGSGRNFVCRPDPSGKGHRRAFAGLAACAAIASGFSFVWSVRPLNRPAAIRPYADHLRTIGRELGLTARDWRLDPPVFDDRALADIYRSRPTSLSIPARRFEAKPSPISVWRPWAAENRAWCHPWLVSATWCATAKTAWSCPTTDPSDWAAAFDRLVVRARNAGADGPAVSRPSRWISVTDHIALRLEEDL